MEGADDMKLILVTIWAIACFLVGDWLLRKGLTYQFQGVRRGILIQILAAIVTLGLPILVAFIVK
jgi:hypothetical protein